MALPSSPSRHRQIGLVLLLAYAMGIGTVMVSVVGVLAPLLRADLGLSRTQIGWQVTVLSLVAVVFSPLAGRATDRLGGRMILLGVFGVGGAAALVMALAPSFAWLLVAAAVAGLSMAASNPGTNKLLGMRIPPGRRGTAMGIKQSGAQAAGLLCGLALPPIAEAWGWRMAVAMVGVFALAGVAAALLVPGDPGCPGGPRRASSMRGGFPILRPMTVSAVFIGAGAGSVASFVPLYSQEQLGLSVAAAGATGAVMGLSGLVARVLWGRATEHVTSFLMPMALIAGLSGLAATLIWMASYVPMLVWVGSVVAGASAMSWMVVAMLGVVVRVPPDFAGRESARLYAVWMGGYAVGPALTGFVVDASGLWAIGWMLTSALFGLGLLVSVGGHRRLCRAENRDERGLTVPLKP